MVVNVYFFWRLDTLDVRSHNEKVRGVALALMAYSSRNDNNVAGADSGLWAAFASKADARFATRDTEELVCCGVIMVERVHCVAPCWRPVIFAEELLTCFGCVAGHGEGVAINEQRNVGVVG